MVRRVCQGCNHVWSLPKSLANEKVSRNAVSMRVLRVTDPVGHSMMSLQRDSVASRNVCPSCGSASFKQYAA